MRWGCAWKGGIYICIYICFLDNVVAILKKKKCCLSALMQDKLRRYIYMYIHLFFGQCSGYKKTCCLSALMQDALRVHMKRCVSQKNWPSSLEICVCKAHTKFSGSWSIGLFALKIGLFFGKLWRKALLEKRVEYRCWCRFASWT